MARAWFVLLLVGTLVLRLGYLQAGILDLAPDEAHYWEWSRRLDVSYYSKPPMVAYIIRLFTSLGGHSVVMVRLGAVLIAALLMGLAFRLGRAVSGRDWVALLAVLFLTAIPLYAAGGVLMTIDPPLMLFWVLGVLAVRRAVRGGWGGWAAAGLALGLGLLSKYTMILLVPCAALALWLHPQGRPWLRRPAPYLATGLGLLAFLPALAWNAAHDWVSFRHTLAMAGTGSGWLIKPDAFVAFVASQAGVVTPLLFVLLLAGMARSAWLGVRGGHVDHLLLAAFSAPVLGFFVGLSLLGKVEANWAAPAYFTAAVAAADLVARGLGRVPVGLVRGFAGVAIVLGLAVAAVGHDTDLLRRAGVELPARLDPSTRLVGWQQLGQEVSRVRQRFGEPPLPLVSDRYQIASELAFYVAGRPRLYVVNLGRRLNQYDLWGGLPALEGRDVLLVTYGEDALDPRLARACDRVEEVEPPVVIRRGGERVASFLIARCRGFRGARPPARLSY